MNRFVALLRGVNVGGRNSLPMAGFRELLDHLGCTNVSSYIQSGNAVFDYPNERRVIEIGIADAIESKFGFRPEVLVLSRADYREIISANPYADRAADPKQVHILFLAASADCPDIARMDELLGDDEDYTLSDRALYLYAPKGIGRSKFAGGVERCLGVPSTGRNARTADKLADMLA